MLNIFSRLLDSNQSTINKYQKSVDQINSLEKKYQKLSDKELSSVSVNFKKSLEKGKTLDEILPDVYAAVREASVRTVKMRHFDVQLLAGIALHNGSIAEQKTGEGKTLSATPALFLNSLSGQGVHLVTVNDYLSMRDAGWMGPIYHALGATVAVIIHEQAFMFDPKYKNPDHFDPRLAHLKPIERKEAYSADITYGTNNEFGFDYLRDNMVRSLVQKVQRGHHFAIVDEVDSILIDEARTPLIISAPSQEPTSKYYEFAKLIDQLDPATDFVLDEKAKTANLSESGILKIETTLKVDNLYEKDFSTLHHVEQSLKARTIFTRDRDYVVRDGEVIIVDEFTGRLMPGRRYSEGLHQAIEAKEGVPIQQESQTLATISFQNYFRMYQKLSGMTGTAATEAEEFHKIYKLDVLVIPTHNPMIRLDQPDFIYKTVLAKFNAVANLVEEIHKTGQPILVGTTSIEKNEFLSGLLKKKSISHSLLNAKNHEKEAEIIERAGEKGAVTVATNMAGRGVDIKLGKDVPSLGGLLVIGTERHESRRIDNQLRGRSGRQGDPGATRFFISLEDDLMRIFGGEQVARVMNLLKIPEDQPIEHGMVSKAIESAQKKVEGHNFDIRKTTVDYDDVMNQQRQIIYGIRDKTLQALGTSNQAIDKSSAYSLQPTASLKQEILDKIQTEIEMIVTLNTEADLNAQQIILDFSTIINFDPNSQAELEAKVSDLGSGEKIIEFLAGLTNELYEAREKEVGETLMREMEGFVYLSTIDTFWIEHLDAIDDLRVGIGLRSFGQREPLVEYKREAFDLFERLIKTIDQEVVHRIFKVSVEGGVQNQSLGPLEQVIERHQEALDQDLLIPPITSAQSQEPSASSGTRVTVERGGQIVSQNTYGQTGEIRKNRPGRNDPCYCGSGKKYKRCHFPN